MLVLLFALLPLSTTGLFNYFGGTQSAAATGWLTCNGQPASGVKVKLYDVNFLYLDHLLDEQTSNSTGGFFVQGSENSMSMIAPRVNFYHKCNYNGLCYQKLAVNIPPQYVATSSMGAYPFFVGQIELAGGYSGQSIDCLNKK